MAGSPWRHGIAAILRYGIPAIVVGGGGFLGGWRSTVNEATKTVNEATKAVNEATKKVDTIVDGVVKATGNLEKAADNFDPGNLKGLFRAYQEEIRVNGTLSATNAKLETQLNALNVQTLAHAYRLKLQSRAEGHVRLTYQLEREESPTKWTPVGDAGGLGPGTFDHSVYFLDKSVGPGHYRIWLTWSPAKFTGGIEVLFALEMAVHGNGAQDSDYKPIFTFANGNSASTNFVAADCEKKTYDFYVRRAPDGPPGGATTSGSPPK